MVAHRLAVAIVMILLASSIAQADQLVVLESNVAALKPGQVLDASKPLQIAAGNRLTLVGEDGKVVKLEGPFSGQPSTVHGSDGDPAMVQALSRLFASSQPSSTSWGTFRGAEAAATFRNVGGLSIDASPLWSVNVRRSETGCVVANEAPALWRPDTGEELTVVLLHLSTGNEAEITFAADQQSAAWPAAVPILDGGEYAVREARNTWERKLQLRVIPSQQETPVQRAAWMSDAGCMRQARAQLAQAL